jgi:hypothetical protein
MVDGDSNRSAGSKYTEWQSAIRPYWQNRKCVMPQSMLNVRFDASSLPNTASKRTSNRSETLVLVQIQPQTDRVNENMYWGQFAQKF